MYTSHTHSHHRYARSSFQILESRNLDHPPSGADMTVVYSSAPSFSSLAFRASISAGVRPRTAIMQRTPVPACPRTASRAHADLPHPGGPVSSCACPRPRGVKMSSACRGDKLWCEWIGCLIAVSYCFVFQPERRGLSIECGIFDCCLC